MVTSKYEIKGNKLIVDLNLKSTERSKSGKTVMIATSNGFQWDNDLGISFNIVKRPE